jgi:hypothetical protein
MGKFYIKRNDTASAFQVTLLDANGDAVDLTGATVKFIMSKGATAKVSSPAVVVSAAAGEVRYDWAAGDTDEGGFFRAEWEVTDAANRVQTFPNPGYDEVVITQDLG